MKPLKISQICIYLLLGNSFADDSHNKDFIGNPVSLFFIIDNSASMWVPPLSSVDPQPSDRWGSRFTVSRALVDTIFKLNPEAQIGLGIFGTSLFFDPTDDTIFKQCPDENKGAYIPLLTLNKTYNGKTGSDIVKYYLEIDTLTDFFNEKYVDLEHQPSDISLQTENNERTNITAGFRAGKHAMLSSSYPEKDHYIIFLSDGEATVGGNEFEAGENVPTTFTNFFGTNNQIPVSLVTMVENIQVNGYSISNPISSLWSIQADHDTLLAFLIENVITKIIDPTYIAGFEGNYTNKNMIFINSCNANTTINYTVNENSNITLDIYNLYGRKVYSLVNDFKHSGSHQVLWNQMNESGIQVSNGCYSIRLVSEIQIITKSFILAR